jgi:N,N'-diacetylchitobiose transport system substrate-binding protein
VAALAVVALGVVAATASASGQRAQANKLTVWLQVDAQSGWPDVVAAATSAFQKQHPGWTVDVQYQNWGDHLQKFDATLAGGNSPDVIEMGNTEMAKYMFAGAFANLTADKSKFDNSGNWLAGLQKSAMYQGKVFGVPYYAGSRVVTYRTDMFKSAGIAKLPTSLAQFQADAKKLAAK